VQIQVRGGTTVRNDNKTITLHLEVSLNGREDLEEIIGILAEALAVRHVLSIKRFNSDNEWWSLTRPDISNDAVTVNAQEVTILASGEEGLGLLDMGIREASLALEDFSFIICWLEIKDLASILGLWSLENDWHARSCRSNGHLTTITINLSNTYTVLGRLVQVQVRGVSAVRNDNKTIILTVILHSEESFNRREDLNEIVCVLVEALARVGHVLSIKRFHFDNEWCRDTWNDSSNDTAASVNAQEVTILASGEDGLGLLDSGIREASLGLEPFDQSVVRIGRNNFETLAIVVLLGTFHFDGSAFLVVVRGGKNGLFAVIVDMSNLHT
jgi:hypothetical protein